MSGKKLLLVEDNLLLCGILKKWLLKAGYDVVTATDEPSARRLIGKHDVGVVLTDVRLPAGDGISLLEWSAGQQWDIPFVVMTEYSSIADAVRSVKSGAADYLPKPVYEEQLLAVLRGLRRRPPFGGGERKMLERRSSAMLETERIARRVAQSECSVMILGANGSGKESVARMIHRYSRRHDKPFIAVNCGCVPRELTSSEFFGYVKGAFTGADKDSPGYFATAQGGTLFLDEIGNMPLEIHVSLLRVLQEKVYTPIGSRKECIGDVRILSATNDDMGRAIRDGRFRADLYHRLAEFELHHPSLSECPEDILPLAEFFRLQYSEEMRLGTAGFTESAKSALLSYSWPGNVRELGNRVRRAVLLAESSYLRQEHLGLDGTSCEGGNSSWRILSDETDEKERIEAVLEACGDNVSRTAESLGISRVTLYKKLRKYGLK